MRRLWMGLGIVLALSLGLTACVANTGEETEGLAQGLTVLDAQEGSLSLAYRSADVVIYMEALRGDPVPEIYQEAEGMPDYQVDALFTDENGFVFYSQQGGDGFLDPSWADRIADQKASPTPYASNEVLYRLAGEAAVVMRDEIEAQVGPELAASLDPEISAIHDFAVHAPKVYADQMDLINANRVEEGLPLVETDGPEGDVVYGSGGPEDSSHVRNDGLYSLEVHHETITYVGVKAKHSATVMYRSSPWLATYTMCNHGACAVNMGLKCGFSARQLSNGRQDTCSGEYKWDSDGGDHGHNCHDDTRSQEYNFVLDAWAGGHWRWCNGHDDDTDISIDVWGIELDQEGSPRCDGNGHKGYGWNP